MNPAASIPPAPAAPPSAVAAASGGLTRRRKVVVAIEIALIAAILAFAWVRPTAREASRARVTALVEAVRARFVVGMPRDELDETIRAVDAEFSSVTASSFCGTGNPAAMLICGDPAGVLREGLPRAMLASRMRTRMWAAGSGDRMEADGWVGFDTWRRGPLTAIRSELPQ